jgi:hypothetical protein
LRRDAPHGDTALRAGRAAELFGVSILLLLLAALLEPPVAAALVLEDFVALCDDAAEVPRA